MTREEARQYRRTERRRIRDARILATLREHGNGYSTATAGLRSAVERNFGSWAKGCLAAGLEAPKRGRPPGSKDKKLRKRRKT